MLRGLALAALVAVGAAGTTGCASQAPQVKVLGVSQPRDQILDQKIMVFVEVVNPGKHPMKLSRLEYQFQAARWFTGQGDVPLARQISAGESAIVEIPVPVEARGPQASELSGIPFTLEGKLFAVDDQLERSWTVKAKGALRKAGTEGALQIRVAAR